MDSYYWERLVMFQTTFLFVGATSLVLLLWTVFISWWFQFKKRNLGWRRKYGMPIALFWSIPSMNFLGPLGEELLFRGPLLILFDRINFLAIVGIVISSFCFALEHWNAYPRYSQTKMAEATDEMMDEDTFEDLTDGQIAVRRSIKLTAMFVMGSIFGYAVIFCQTLWAGILLHFLVNSASLIALALGGTLFLLSRLARGEPIFGPSSGPPGAS
jgi:membrane protease YdiL (CAAX protease family)